MLRSRSTLPLSFQVALPFQIVRPFSGRVDGSACGRVRRARRADIAAAN